MIFDHLRQFDVIFPLHHFHDPKVTPAVTLICEEQYLPNQT
jgi:hypothetical protein